MAEIELLAALGLLGFLAWVLFTGPGLDRSFVIHGLVLSTALIGAYVIGLSQDWIALAGWTLLCTNILRRPYPMQHQARLAMILLFYVLYAVTPPIPTDYLLFGIVGVIVSLVPAWAWGLLLVQHESYRDMLLTIGIACAVTLMLHGWVWAGLAIPPMLIPFFAYRDLSTSLQGHIWLASIVVMVVAWYWPILAVAPLLMGLAWFTWQPRSYSAGLRWWWWKQLLAAQWQSGWMARLFGMGHDSWQQWADSLVGLMKQKTGKQDQETLLNPHNEYVSILFEHGAVGLFILLAWISALLWQAWRVDPPLLIPALTLCGIAVTLFPWTFPREIPIQGKTWVRYEPFGHIGTVILSILIAILLRGAS